MENVSNYLKAAAHDPIVERFPKSTGCNAWVGRGTPVRSILPWLVDWWSEEEQNIRGAQWLARQNILGPARMIKVFVGAASYLIEKDHDCKVMHIT